jgi:hypothetical protein
MYPLYWRISRTSQWMSTCTPNIRDLLSQWFNGKHWLKNYKNYFIVYKPTTLLLYCVLSPSFPIQNHKIILVLPYPYSQRSMFSMSSLHQIEWNCQYNLRDWCSFTIDKTQQRQIIDSPQLLKIKELKWFRGK